MLDGQYDGALLGAAVVGWEDGLKEGIPVVGYEVEGVPVVGYEDEGAAVVGRFDGSELGTTVKGSCDEGVQEGAVVVGWKYGLKEGMPVDGRHDGHTEGTSVVGRCEE